MNEQFDRALRNHIRDTFDHYDDLMADDGWKKFKKQQNKKKRGLIFWYGLPSGIAAALAFLWLFNAPAPTGTVTKPQNKLATKTELPKATEQGTPKSNVLTADNAGHNLANKTIKPLVSKKVRILKQTMQQHFAVAETTETEKLQIDLVTVYPIMSATLQTDRGLPVPLQASHTPQEETLAGNTDYLAFNNSLLKTADNHKNSNVSDNKQTESKKSRSLNFAVDANTYYSFTSAGINDDLNLGIGILSELKLSKRLSINSGISINKQSTIYQNAQPAGRQSFNSVASPTALLSQVNKQSFSVPESVETNAKLVGFDIPINIKYDIPIGKAKTFVSTGISSYSLLNQSYANDVSVTNYSLTSAPTTTVFRKVEKETESAFSNFQFARTVNFSFGILYPLSSKNSISVEPFVKYPIAGFGNQNLEIGSGGVSFKINFGK